MSREDRKRLIAAAREAGFSDTEILREVLAGEYGGDRRRTLVVEWGELLGLDAKTALRVAQRAALIPTVHPPKRTAAAVLPGKGRGTPVG